jgi:hypothetical protein
MEIKIAGTIVDAGSVVCPKDLTNPLYFQIQRNKSWAESLILLSWLIYNLLAGCVVLVLGLNDLAKLNFNVFYSWSK